MSTSIFTPANDIGLAALSSLELERFDIVMDIITKYTTKGQPTQDLFVILPDHINPLFTSTVENGELSDFTLALFLRLVVADVNTVIIPAATPDPEDDKSVYRLSSLFTYFMDVIKDKPLLGKRGQMNMLALFLSQLVIDASAMSKMEVLTRIYDNLSHTPELSFVHLYNSSLSVPESLDIGMTLLRNLVKGHPLPSLDLAVALTGEGNVALTKDDIFGYLLEPNNADIAVLEVETVIRPHPVPDEDKDKWLEQLASRESVSFTDMVSEMVGGEFESERVARFVLRRLADIVAQVLNRDCSLAQCHGYQDIYPWIIQYHERLISSTK